MLKLIEAAPVLTIVVAAVSMLFRLIALKMVLKGARPADRPEIIRALAEFFRLLPRRRK
ncbi:hypothetical protein [Amycolatopsis anabasis]|uniref:hypothetical protein n=1 Tax=Amycolatopsis anabasis TaxID=1840409 RepID=UPI00131CE196|nr:hypothetical protein [Amycolatopsis anabasis]